MSSSVRVEKENYMVLDHNGMHEYNLTVIKHGEYERTISLFYSMSEEWTDDVRGEMALSMTDNGNGVKFDRKLKKLDYSELLHLRILLNFEHKTTSIILDRDDYIVIPMSNEINV
jgi:hypothetical protein